MSPAMKKYFGKTLRPSIGTVKYVAFTYDTVPDERASPADPEEIKYIIPPGKKS